MRVKVKDLKSGDISYTIIKSVYDANGHETTKSIALYRHSKLIAEGISDPEAYVRELASKMTDDTPNVINFKVNKAEKIDYNCPLHNIGYMILGSVFDKLELKSVLKNIEKNTKFKSSLYEILSTLTYARILNPSSKLESFDYLQTIYHPIKYNKNAMYNSFKYFANNIDKIKSEVFFGSKNIVDRDFSIVYYDLTNFYFEIEEADIDPNEGNKKKDEIDGHVYRKFGMGKEHRPNPIVQLALAIDRNGIPLAYELYSGNQSETKTLIPFEKKLARDFNIHNPIICTDAGLASNTNKLFNMDNDRGYITVQSIKKLSKDMKEWVRNPKGWRCPLVNNNKYIKEESMIEVMSITKQMYDAVMEGSDERLKRHYKTLYNQIYYKEYTERGNPERLIVTYSLKYRFYLDDIIDKRYERASKMIDGTKLSSKKPRQEDPKRYIIVSYTNSKNKKIILTPDKYELDKELLIQDKLFDGFYMVSTNVRLTNKITKDAIKDDILNIIRINKNRWEIEENFRIMKSEFKSRPAYVSTEESIQLHFLTCYLALFLYRVLEKLINEAGDIHFTAKEIIETLQKLNVNETSKGIYSPAYANSDLIQTLNKLFDVELDNQWYEGGDLNRIEKIISKKQFKK